MKFSCTILVSVNKYGIFRIIFEKFSTIFIKMDKDITDVYLSEASDGRLVKMEVDYAE